MATCVMGLLWLIIKLWIFQNTDQT
jgi:hypothetical protein